MKTVKRVLSLALILVMVFSYYLFEPSKALANGIQRREAIPMTTGETCSPNRNTPTLPMAARWGRQRTRSPMDMRRSTRRGRIS